MLDPAWSEEAGYSHADKLLEIIRKQEREEQENKENDAERK